MKMSIKHWSDRTIRLFYSFAAIAVFLVCTYHMIDSMVLKTISNDQCGWVANEKGKPGLIIRDVLPGGVTDRAGVKDGDTLLQINGIKIDISNASSILNGMKRGDTATYTVARGTTRFQAKIEIIKLFNTFEFSLYLLGFAFLVVGYVVVMTKPDGMIQRMFGGYGIFTMLVFGLYVPNLSHDPLWKVVLLLSFFLIGRIFAPPFMVKFFLNFPVRNNCLEKKWLSPLLYSISIVAIFPLFIGSRLDPAIGQYIFALPIIFFVTGLGLFTGGYRKVSDIQRRKQLRPIFIGVTIGILVFWYIAILTGVRPFAVATQPILMLPVVLILATPFTFGYAIFRYGLMDIDLIIERSLIYGVVTASLAAIYLGVVFGVGTLLGIIMGNSDSKVLNVAAFVIIAFVFDPIKQRVQESIDRTFYRERRDYQKALSEFSQELPRLINMEQIMNSIVNRISGTMHVDKIAVIICDEREGCFSTAKNIDKECCDFTDTQNGLIEHLRREKVAQTLYFLGENRDATDINQTDAEKILRAGIILAVPMLIQERLIGLIAAGPKLSGKVYSHDDIDLLTTVANQAAISIENSRLHQSELEKQKIEEELEMARRIQQGLLPKKNPSVEHLDIAGISIPALSVGGDYFDFISLDPDKLLVVVADVSGKGMSAALYMSKIQGMIQLAAHMYTTPKEMLIHVNRLLYDGIERKSFITMILGLFDTKKNSVSLCRAGHNKAIVGTNGKITYLESNGIGLGLERGPIFEEALQEIEFPLMKESLVMFYSDGLPETMNDKQMQLGEDTICNIIQTYRNQTARELQNQLISAAEKFRGSADQHDDITIVVVKTR
jgi:sigma-B regulation protein RsbU (phosphoserine phosphatase)